MRLPLIPVPFSHETIDGFVLPPADLAKLIASETEKWANVIRAANIKAE